MESSFDGAGPIGRFMTLQPPTIPVATLHYQPPRRLDRPGIMTAMGVMSIVIASLSGLFSLGTALSAIGMLVISSRPISIPVPAAPSTTGATTVTAGTRVVTPAPATMPFLFQVNRTASILSICESGGSLLIAVVLLVGGILALRDSPHALKLHWTYAMVKIPLVVVAGVAQWMSSTTMMANMRMMSPGATPRMAWGSILMVPAVMWALFGMAYPIGVMIVLKTRTVKTYASSIQTGRR